LKSDGNFQEFAGAFLETGIRGDELMELSTGRHTGSIRTTA
jgi:hypothetical protein